MIISDETNAATMADGRDEEKEKESSPEGNALSAILKTEARFPPREGEIVEGPILSRGTAAVFVDLGTRGTGIIFGREFFLARDVLRGKKAGDTISAKIVDPENADGYVELSANAAGRELAWEELRQAFDEKRTITVTIESANRGGLIATVENITGFLPVSHLAPDHYPHVEGGDKEKILDALRKFSGQEIAVKIINLDPNTDKLILSERAVLEEELRSELTNFHVGDTIDGSISGIVDFGLFVRFGPDDKLEGLAHISELSWEKVENIRQNFKIGESVKAKILDIQGDRVSLSLKALLPAPPETGAPEAISPEDVGTTAETTPPASDETPTIAEPSAENAPAPANETADIPSEDESLGNAA